MGTGWFFESLTITWRFMWISLGVIRRSRSLAALPAIYFGCCVLVTTAVLTIEALAFDDTTILSIDAAPRPLKVSAPDLPRLAHTAVNCLLGWQNGPPCPFVSQRERDPLWSEQKQTAAPNAEADRKRAEHLGLLAFIFYFAN